MIDLRNLTCEEMEELAVSAGQKAFRGRQLFAWVQKGICDFREMTNLPGVFLRFLEENCRLDSLRLLRRQISAKDGTQKFLSEVPGGDAVETVFMRYHYGNSVCVSSQAGCRMGCAFCASGINGLSRDLAAGEILSQLMNAERETGEAVGHLVLMGTGEPFDNYEEVAKALTILHDPRGRGMSWRNITVSTCGLIPGIRRFAEEFPQVNLAVSLHAPDDEVRRKIMPVSRSYPYEELLAACRAYTDATHRRITFEYALIRDVNDRAEHAEKLARRLSGMLAHVNLIPLNAVRETGFKTSAAEGTAEFRKILERAGIPVTVRRQLGADIDGACGQLRLTNTKY